MSSMEPAKTDGFKRMKLGEKERKKEKKKRKIQPMALCGWGSSCSYYAFMLIAQHSSTMWC